MRIIFAIIAALALAGCGDFRTKGDIDKGNSDSDSLSMGPQ